MAAVRVSSARMDAYSDEVNEVAETAAELAMRAYDEMRRRNPLASVAEVREGCIAIVESVVTSYGAAAGELAAEMYDALAGASSADVDEAVVPDVDETTLDVIDATVRYDVGELVPDREDI